MQTKNTIKKKEFLQLTIYVVGKRKNIFALRIFIICNKNKKVNIKNKNLGEKILWLHRIQF